jgi:hypothetical protein
VSAGDGGEGSYAFEGTADGVRPAEAYHSGFISGAYGWGSTTIGVSMQHGAASDGGYGWDGIAFAILTHFNEERMLHVSAEDRTLRVGAEDRTLYVAADDRTLRVAADDRTLYVGAEDRTLHVKARE